MSKNTETIRTFYATAARWDFESPYVEKFTNDFNEWLADYKKEVLDEAAERAEAEMNLWGWGGDNALVRDIVAAVRGEDTTELSWMDEHRNSPKPFCHHCSRFVEPTHVCEE